MNSNQVASHQSGTTLEVNALQASQQLQRDKQLYGSDHIHLYVDDVEGDWLEEWTWEDDLADYIDAFDHHCQQKNYRLAIETLRAGFDLLKKPENLRRGVEIYSRLVKLLESESEDQLDTNPSILLEEARAELHKLGASSGNNPMRNSDYQKIMMQDLALENMQKVLDKAHNGIIRRTWKFTLFIDDEPASYIFEKKVTVEAINEESAIELGISGTSPNSCYFLTLRQGEETEELFKENPFFSSASPDGFRLIEDYLEKLEQANKERLSAAIDALPE
jgi:hypothetical protein